MIDEQTPDYGRKLRALCKQAGWSQKVLEVSAGLGKTTIGNAVGGRGILTKKTNDAIVGALNQRLAELGKPLVNPDELYSLWRGQRPKSQIPVFQLSPMRVEHRDPKVIAARRTFWESLERAATASGIADLRSLISNAKMPPNLPLKDGDVENLAKSFCESPTQLSDSQRALWLFVLKIYSVAPGYKCIKPSIRRDVDNSRRFLAHFWDYYVFNAIETEGDSVIARIADHFDHERRSIYMLSWLELGRYLVDRTEGKGKRRLFLLGRFFQEHQ